MFNKFYLIVVLISTLFSLPCYADNSKETLKLINEYLFQIKTIETEFSQTDSQENIRQGYAYIKKPNRIRVEYYSPEKEIILLNSDLIMHYNKDLDETNYLPRESFILDILSQKNFRLLEQTKVQRLEVGVKEIELDFTMLKDKTSTITSLKFSKVPFRLKSMKIYQNNDSISLNFINLMINSKLDNDLFNFNNKRMRQ